MNALLRRLYPQTASQLKGRLMAARGLDPSSAAARRKVSSRILADHCRKCTLTKGIFGDPTGSDKAENIVNCWRTRAPNWDQFGRDGRAAGKNWIHFTTAHCLKKRATRRSQGRESLPQMYYSETSCAQIAGHAERSSSRETQSSGGGIRTPDTRIMIPAGDLANMVPDGDLDQLDGDVCTYVCTEATSDEALAQIVTGWRGVPHVVRAVIANLIQSSAASTLY